MPALTPPWRLRGIISLALALARVADAPGWRSRTLTRAATAVFLRAQPYETRKPQQFGDPISYVLWQKFANHVQKIADSLGTGKPGDY